MAGFYGPRSSAGGSARRLGSATATRSIEKERRLVTFELPFTFTRKTIV